MPLGKALPSTRRPMQVVVVESDEALLQVTVRPPIVWLGRKPAGYTVTVDNPALPYASPSPACRLQRQTSSPSVTSTGTVSPGQVVRVVPT